MANLYGSCQLDDISAQALVDFKQEMQDIEVVTDTIVSAMTAVSALLEASTKTAATCYLYDESDDSYVKLTWKVAGAIGNDWQVMLLPDMTYPTSVLSHEVDDDNKIISIYMVIDLGDTDPGAIRTTSKSLYDYIVANLSSYVSATLVTPHQGTGDSLTKFHPWFLSLVDTGASFDTSWAGEKLILISGSTVPGNNAESLLYTVPSSTEVYIFNPLGATEASFSGTWQITDEMKLQTATFANGNEASLTNTSIILNTMLAPVGLTYPEALKNLNVPVYTSDSQVLADLADVVVLSTGKTFEKKGTNLVEPEALWTEIGATATASATLLKLLPGTDGDPIVVWTKTVSTTIAVPQCDGGGIQTTSIVEYVALNSKPTGLDSTYTPKVWWITSINPSAVNQRKLEGYGFSKDQLTKAFDSTDTNTHIIPEPDVFSSNNLTASEVTELLGLDVDGIEPISWPNMLKKAAAKPPGPTTGWLAPSLNIPMDKFLANMGLDPTTTTDLVNDTECFDPLAKTGLVSMLAAIGSAIDTFAITVKRICDAAKAPINKAASMLSTVNELLKDMQKQSCIMGLTLESGLPDMSVLELQLKFFVKDVSIFLDLTMLAFDAVTPAICKVKKAILDLLAGADAETKCFAAALTDAVLNKFGAEVQAAASSSLSRLTELIPCIVNPLSYLTMINEMLSKLNSMTSMINGVLDSLNRLSAALKPLVNLKFETPYKETSVECDSLSLSMIVSKIRKSVGLS